MPNGERDTAPAVRPVLPGRGLPGSARWTAQSLLFEKILFLDRLRDLYERARATVDRPIFESLLNELQVRYEVRPEGLAGIPKTGPIVVVANHPFGMLEGAILGAMLPRVRCDVKIMANYLLGSLPEIASRCIFVDPFKDPCSITSNVRALKEAVAWLKAGCLLVIFPAGEVSHWNLHEIADPEWSDTVSRLVRLTSSAVVPVFFKGTNSLPFHLLGLLHPRLRTARLPGELLNKMGKNVEVRVGSLISHKTITAISSDRDAIAYLRWRTYLLARRGEPELRLVPRIIQSVVPKKSAESLAAPTPREMLLEDIRHLNAEQCVEDAREYSVFLAGSEQLPNVLRELGRLREITFREVGEGTGKSLDLDTFDAYYLHLVLWNNARQELVGAYRLGHTDEILALFGPRGLYTSTLFHYEPTFFQRIGPAVELGRSFVRPEYQRQYQPLLLLWKGLGTYVARNPEAPVLFGAVSVSNEYNPLSRRLIAQFLECHLREQDLAGLVRPRRPFRAAFRQDLNTHVIGRLLRDLDSLSVPISDLEGDGKGLPILLKQYLRLGGKLLGFNVDVNFTETLDGLVLVDLRQTEPALLQRYMKPEGAARFLQFHRSRFAPSVAV
jgi:putative hemolysin